MCAVRNEFVESKNECLGTVTSHGDVRRTPTIVHFDTATLLSNDIALQRVTQ